MMPVAVKAGYSFDRMRSSTFEVQDVLNHEKLKISVSLIGKII